MEHAGAHDRVRQVAIEAVASIAKLLSCAVRLEVLVSLTDRPACVSEIASRMDLEQSLISRHLGRLRAAGLAVCTQSGHRHLYSLTSAVRVTRERGGVTVWVHAAGGGLGFIVPEDPAPRIEVRTGARGALDQHSVNHRPS